MILKVPPRLARCVVLWTVIFGVQSPATGWAAEILDGRVTRNGSEFVVAFTVTVDAKPHQVREVLSDLRNLSELSPTIISSNIVGSVVSGKQRLYMVLQPCVLFYCRTVVKVSDVRRVNPNRWEFDAIPERGDFERARESLSVASHGPISVVRYEAHLQPKFRIPWILGTWAMRLVFGRELRAAAHSIERRYRTSPPPSD